MEDRKYILKRSEQKKEDTWAVEDLYPTDDAWREALQALRGREQELAAFQGRLAENGQTLLDYFRKMEELEAVVNRLNVYSMIRGDEDARNSEHQEMKGQLNGYLVQFQQAEAFELPELSSIPDDTLARFYEEVPELKRYERYLYLARRRKAHTLSKAEEELLASAGEMADSPSNIFSSFVSADLTFPSVKDLTGEVYPLTNGSYVSIMESQKPILRRNAFYNLYETYDKFRNTSAAMLNAHVRQNIFFARARKYDSCLEAALDRTEIPISVYHNLVKAVRQNLDKMHRYVKLRKKLMDVEELHMYDIYTPLVPGCDKEIPFEQTREEVLAAMSVFGPEYGMVLESSFDDRWMDIYENEGKRAGAYATGSAEHPYVLLNYKNNLDSEFTVAHELGHAMHSYLSHKHQPPVYEHYVIFVAEVASTCNEALLMHYLLEHTEDKKKRASLINYFLEQFRTTLYRQTMFAEFEQMIHARAEAGEALTAEILKDMYYQLNQDYYGEDMVVDPLIAIEWARVPHFYYNFYVYQYATGFSAAIALSRRILREGKPAVEDYLKFLSSGCSMDPISLLKLAGVDMTTAEPVAQALELFDSLIDEMEELMQA